MNASRTQHMKAIHDEVMNLTISPLYAYRTQNNYYPVLGEGSHTANIVFVGEAPGKNEAETGRPFCGRAGEVLDELLAHAEIVREEVYITNIVKDRPPKNRDPLPEEIAVYAPFLDRQLAVIKPRVIATLGRFAMRHLMDRYGLEEERGTISALRGQVFAAEAPFGSVKIVPLFHPAAAIYDPSKKEILMQDIAHVAKRAQEK